jgi:hypothetical protein
MRPGLKRRKRLFDPGQDIPHAIPILFPRKVNGKGVSSVAGTHPEVIRRDGAHFGNQEEWRNVLSDSVYGVERGKGMLAGNEVFTLQFFAAARREVHAEVW